MNVGASASFLTRGSRSRNLADRSGKRPRLAVRRPAPAPCRSPLPRCAGPAPRLSRRASVPGCGAPPPTGTGPQLPHRRSLAGSDSPRAWSRPGRREPRPSRSHPHTMPTAAPPPLKQPERSSPRARSSVTRSIGSWRRSAAATDSFARQALAVASSLSRSYASWARSRSPELSALPAIMRCMLMCWSTSPKIELRISTSSPGRSVASPLNM